MGEFDNEIKRWGEVDVPYLPSQLICSSGNDIKPLKVFRVFLANRHQTCGQLISPLVSDWSEIALYFERNGQTPLYSRAVKKTFGPGQWWVGVSSLPPYRFTSGKYIS
ncbi:hypothetical protein J6590_065061 [Homalodisca vitripennis]|nr:hypothetical protein J6590_065061 [Homalodisca vitripennis]